MQSVERLLAIMAQLRDPQGGCPWDVRQDFRSIAPHTVEEAYEVADAIERGDLDDLRDELGDLLFQVVFHARMAEEQEQFAFDDVARAIADKLVRRHPHVFAQADIPDVEAQRRSWEAIKAEERQRKRDSRPQESGAVSALDGVSRTLPGLTRALKLQARAARVGFDWDDPACVMDKIAEEAGEIQAELEQGAEPHRVEEEMGDLLFACANLSRHLGVDPESALRRANTKFERRFRRVEALLADAGRSPEDSDLETMEQAWQQAKREEKA